MTNRRLTDRSVKAMKPAKPGRRYDVMDAIVPGFGLRVNERGRRTFILVARFPGSKNPTRRSLGEYGALTLEKAREKSRNWLELLGKGIDPATIKEAERQAQACREDNTFALVAEEFIKRHVSKTRKAKEVERDLRNEFISRWGSRPLVSISTHDVVAVIDNAVDRGAPYQAHNLLGDVAIGRDLVPRDNRTFPGSKPVIKTHANDVIAHLRRRRNGCAQECRAIRNISRVEVQVFQLP